MSIDWTALTPRERDTLVAQQLGLPLEPPCPYHHETDGAQYDDGEWTGWCYSCRCLISEVPAEPRHYTERIEAVRQVEDALERRGLGSQYAGALAGVVAGDLWAIIRATPEQRCRAALIAVGVLTD